MDQGPLVMEQIRAGERLVREFAKTMPLRAAFWLKGGGEEEGEWDLYLACDDIDKTGKLPAYTEVGRILHGGSTFWLESMQVKAIDSNNPVARDVIATQQKYPTPYPSRLRTQMLGDRYVAEAVLYPMPLPDPLVV